MHLHAHLADCIFDYEPSLSVGSGCSVLKGNLGEYYTNDKSIELRLMRKFQIIAQIKDHAICNLEFPEGFKVQLGCKVISTD